MSHGEQADPVLKDTQPENDHRLYVPYSSGWTAHIKQSGGSERCFSQHPGQDYFHLIVKGEIYLQKEEEMFCLTCAMRRGILSRDRMAWQREPEAPEIKPLDDPFDEPLRLADPKSG